MNFNAACPEPPPLSDWKFIDEFSKPEIRKVRWFRKKAGKNEIDISKGVRLIFAFPDPEKLLETACSDFESFLDKALIPKTGNYRITTFFEKMEKTESFIIDIKKNECRISASDIEGIRRGIYFLEDELLRADGPFLALKQVVRTPFITTRISRCFYGPTKREPEYRDELLDDIDYYPEEYLNRLAREGTNGVWISIKFKEICKSSVIPEYACSKDVERRLEKLRRVVKRCRRYGIKVFLFGIEPEPLDSNSAVIREFPDIAGARISADSSCLCLSSGIGKQYLEEALYFLFSKVPHLGGYINISVGEQPTHCYSAGYTTTCTKCAERSPSEVLNDGIRAMERGMHRANPDAELIIWPYSQFSVWGVANTEEYARHIPEKAVLQYNFETAGIKEELGKKHRIFDYLLSYIGPSEHFSTCAKNIVKSGGRISAKLQIANSHEVATVPFVPVPGNIYGKFKAMRELGVSMYMGCWFFGGCPSVMTKAAAELSFEPFPKSEKEFLTRLAETCWGKNADKVVKAWTFFQKGYNNYPVNSLVGYYGPMHDGPVWPLYLNTVNKPLVPTWRLKKYASAEYLPPAGDRIGEFITHDYSIEDILTLFGIINENWEKGMKILRSIRSDYLDDPEHLRDIGVAEALGLQFKSGLNITRFYDLREQLNGLEPGNKLELLAQMKGIVRNELEIDRKLLGLCREDSRLGYHGEAEGHKYYPEKIQWRMKQLRYLLHNEFPVLEGIIKNKAKSNPVNNNLQQCCCTRVEKEPEMNGKPFGGIWDELEENECLWNAALLKDKSCRVLDREFSPGCRTFWKTCYTDKYLYVGVYCYEPDMNGTIDDFIVLHDSDLLELQLEVRSLWPSFCFYVTPSGRKTQRICDESVWDVSSYKGADYWSVIFRFAFKTLNKYSFNGHTLRLNITRSKPGNIEDCFIIQQAWQPKKADFPRLLYGLDVSACNYGELHIDDKKTANTYLKGRMI